MARRQGPTSCSFCGKRPEQVQRLIGGPNGVSICNECVALCNQILEDLHTVPSPQRDEGAGRMGHRRRSVWRCFWATLVALLTPWRRRTL